MFIVLEGGEGAGKSTLAAALAERVAVMGFEIVLTREPGGTPAGERVRELLHEPLTPWAETFAFMAARAQLVAEVIRPALDRGAVVLCDRFAASTFAYQGFGRGLDAAALKNVNAIATHMLEPAVTILLDIDPVIGLKRKHGEVEAIRTGQEDLAFHQRVRRGYQTLAQNSAPGTWITLDAAGPVEAVLEDAWAFIEPRLRRARASAQAQ